MADEIVYTEEQYKTFIAAMAQGATRVKYGDKEVDYRTLNDMLRIKSMMEAQLFPNKKKIQRKYLSFKRGHA